MLLTGGQNLEHYNANFNNIYYILIRSFDLDGITAAVALSVLSSSPITRPSDSISPEG